ncbi:hypothetical protein PTRA_b0301 [Pseudoalteromonas translucida KMM 520]|uniref:Proline racemase n=1 Tax=Pseudoalteromonas translucida KMM 520 TaxID=1315283 RepID=A0A0U2LRS0_9GAMM|nr:hypothetical protein PTRA_b0301 [Pseudoalteromonas translucida KMM 520]
MAQLFSKGKLAQGQEFVHESYIGSQFIGCVEQLTEVAGRAAILPSICSWSRVTGSSSITVDDDPYAFGFQVI